MKTLLSILTALFLLNHATFAAVLTVSNDPLGGAQYSSLQAAYNAAADNDTLHLEGTNIPYFMTCGQRWAKPLTVIGIGFNPQKQNPRKTFIRVTDCEQWFIINSGGNGSNFYGIEFMYQVPWSQTSIIVEGNPSNYSFTDCKFQGHLSFNFWNVSNFIFRNCIFDGDNANNLQLAVNTSQVISNILFSNCVFDGYMEGAGNPNITVIIDHCLFLSTTTGGFSQLLHATISNSIFMNVFPGGTTNCTFLNNMCRVAGTFPPVGGGGNTGLNNQDATDPDFVTYANDQPYSAAHDYHLQAGSPAIGAGNDATDIGIHGGTSKFNESGEVLINPILRSVIITNPILSSNGTLNVNIHATKPSSL